VLARRVLLAAPLAGLAVFAIVKWVDVGPAADTAEPPPEAGVWELMIGGCVVLWTALASVGLRMLKTPPPRREALEFVGAVYGAVALLLLFIGLSGITNDRIVAGQQLKNVFLHLVAAAAILPWLLVLKRIQLDAADDDEWSDTAGAIGRIRKLRRALQGATAALGGMIAAAVIITGALREAVEAAPKLTATPDSYVLVYGAWLTAVVAAIYLYVFGAVERRARSIVERVPLPDPASDAFPAAVERRTQLAQELELGGDARANLESLVSVLAPLAGALLTRFGGF